MTAWTAKETLKKRENPSAEPKLTRGLTGEARRSVEILGASSESSAARAQFTSPFSLSESGLCTLA